MKSLIAFGSYLTEVPRLGDVDLSVTLEGKLSQIEQSEADDRRSLEALRAGRSFGNVVDEICWASHEALLFLKSRSRGISFCGTAIEPTRVLYPYPSAGRIAVSMPKAICDALGIEQDKQNERWRLKVLAATARLGESGQDRRYLVLMIEEEEGRKLLQEIVGREDGWLLTQEVSGGAGISAKEAVSILEDARHRLRSALLPRPGRT